MEVRRVLFRSHPRYRRSSALFPEGQRIDDIEDVVCRQSHIFCAPRSEERRVGKECRSRWSSGWRLDVCSSDLILDIVDHPRYFRKGRGSTISRMWYAANRTFFARRDNGSSGFNNSEAFGQLISCGTRNRTAASATSSPIGA